METNAPGTLPPNLQKTMNRIKDLVSSKEYYEAQQAYKSTYYRQRARKQADATQQAYTILKEGAIQQLGSGQVTCGVELGLLLIEAYTEDNVPASGGLEESTESLCAIIKALPPSGAGAHEQTPQDSAPSTAGAADAPSSNDSTNSSSSTRSGAVVVEMSRFVAAAVKWAQKQSDPGSVRTLHTCYAQWLWDTYGLGHLGLAVAHFARGSDTSLFNKVLQSCAAQGHPQEAPLFATRGVLSILAAASPRMHATHTPLQQLEQAETLFRLCQEWVAKDEPLVHFQELLFQALRLRSGPLVRLLSERYSPSLSVDPGLIVLLNRAASAYIKKPRGAPMGGLLGDLMKGISEGEGGMMLDGDEFEDEDDD